METVFSEYELREMGIKLAGANGYRTASCVGTCETEMECKNVTKSCRGTVVKNIPRGTGAGTMTISMHIPYDVYENAYGTDVDNLISGVTAYGRNSRHKGMAITQHVFDEDGVEKYKAYPNCIITTAKKSKIENGAEEVAEVELEISVMPDEYGNGEYEAIAAEIESSVSEAWMTSFTSDLVRSTANNYAIQQTLTGVSCDNTATMLARGTNYMAKYTVLAGYTMPATVTVKVANTTLAAGTGYIWTQTTGALYVPNVIGTLAITVTGTV